MFLPAVPSVRQMSIPVLPSQSCWVTVSAAEGLCGGGTRVPGLAELLLSSWLTRKVSAKVSVPLCSLKYLVCPGQAVLSLWIVGSWGSITYAYVTRLVTGPCQRHNAGLHRWAWALVCYSCSGLPALLCQMSLLEALSCKLEEVAAFELLRVIHLRSHPYSVVC